MKRIYELLDTFRLTNYTVSVGNTRTKFTKYALVIDTDNKQFNIIVNDDELKGNSLGLGYNSIRFNGYISNYKIIKVFNELELDKIYQLLNVISDNEFDKETWLTLHEAILNSK